MYGTLLLVVCACLLAREAGAVGTPAGIDVINQARVSFTQNGVPGSVVSNAATFTMGEILDVNVTLQSVQMSVIAGETRRTQLFRVTNTGNGSEALPFAVDNLVAGDDFDPLASVPAIFLDSDASGELSNSAGEYIVGEAQLALVKNATVLDPSGGSRPVSGSRITYQIVVNVSGSGTARAVDIDDAIPVDTTYLAGSLRLNGAPLTDASDGDGGEFQAVPGRVRVTLGDLSQASGAQTVAFAVTIN